MQKDFRKYHSNIMISISPCAHRSLLKLAYCEEAYWNVIEAVGMCELLYLYMLTAQIRLHFPMCSFDANVGFNPSRIQGVTYWHISWKTENRRKASLCKKYINLDLCNQYLRSACVHWYSIKNVKQSAIRHVSLYEYSICMQTCQMVCKEMQLHIHQVTT